MPLIPGPVGTAYSPDLEVPNVVGQVNTMRELAQRDRQLRMQQQQIDQQGQAQQSLRTHQQQQAVASRLNSLVQVMQTQPEAAEKLINADPELLSALKLPGGVKFLDRVHDYQLFQNKDTGDVHAIDPRQPSLGMKWVGNIGPGKMSLDEMKAAAFAKLSPDEKAAAVTGSGNVATPTRVRGEILNKYAQGGKLTDREQQIVADDLQDPYVKQAVRVVLDESRATGKKPNPQKILDVAAQLRGASGAAAPASPLPAPGQGGGVPGAGAGAATGAGTFPVVQPLGTALPPVASSPPSAALGRIQDQLQVGTTATNPKTKERVTWDGTAWVPAK